MSLRWLRRSAALALPFALVAAACSSSSDSSTTASGSAGECTPAEVPVINFAAYSTPREAYGKIIPAFVSQWKEDHDDQNVIFQESYAGSTTQAANVIAGYEADVVALSLAPDVDQIADAGLITSDWTAQPDNGMVSTSVVVFDVRPGNPLGIKDWNDLAVGRRDPDAGPRVERRRALEPRVPVGRGPARLRRRDEGRHGRRDDADAERARQRDGLRQERA